MVLVRFCRWFLKGFSLHLSVILNENLNLI
jgi:hypothetical protein